MLCTPAPHASAHPPAPTHRPLADFAAQANAAALQGDGGGVSRPEDAHRDRPDAVEEEITEVKRSLQQLHRLHEQEEASRGRRGRYARPLELERRRLHARLAVLEPASLLDEVSPPPRASAPLPSASAASASGVPTLHGLADRALDAAVGFVGEGLLPEGPRVPTPLEQHGRPCVVRRFVESDV